MPRQDKSGSAKRNRRDQVRNPALRLNFGVRPTVTESITIPRLGRTGNVGSALRDLAGALKGFGGTLTALHKKREAELAAEARKKEAKGKKEDTKDADEFAFYMGIIGGNPVDPSQLKGLSSDYLPDLESKGITGGHITMGQGTIDIDNLKRATEAKKQQLDNIDKGLDESITRGDLKPQEDPRVVYAGAVSSAQAGFEKEFNKTLSLIDSTDDPALIDTTVADLRQQAATIIQNAPPSARKSLAKSYATKILTASRKGNDTANELKFHQAKQEIIGSGQVQLEGILDDYDLLEDPEALSESILLIGDTMNGLHKLDKSLGGANSWYTKNVLGPVLMDKAEENPLEVLELVKALEEHRLPTGGKFGNIKEVQPVLNQLRGHIEDLQTSEGPAAAAKERVALAKFEISNELRRRQIEAGSLTEVTPEIEAGLDEWAKEKFGNNFEWPTLVDYKAGLVKAENTKPAKDNEFKNEVDGLILDEDFDGAREIITARRDSGTISNTDAIELYDRIDRKDFEKKLTGSGTNYIEFTQTFDTEAVETVRETLLEKGYNPDLVTHILSVSDDVFDKVFADVLDKRKDLYVEQWKESGLPPSKFELSPDLQEVLEKQMIDAIKARLPVLLKVTEERTQKLGERLNVSIQMIEDDSVDDETFFESIKAWWSK